MEIILPAIFVFANIVLFLLCWYHSSKILHPIQMSSSRPAHQTAIAVLVKRMKYYPIIQCVLLVMMDFAVIGGGAAFFDFFNMLIPLSALSYLVLFLKMQPLALDHLKYRLGLGGKPVSPAKGPSQHSTTTTKTTTSTTTAASGAAKSSTTTSLSASLVESRYDTDVVDYDNMEDDELSFIIRNSSSVGSGSDNGIGNVINQSQL